MASACLHALLLAAFARLVLPALHQPAPEWAIPLVFAPAPATQPDAAPPADEPAATIPAAILPPPMPATETITLRPPPRIHATASPARRVAAAAPPAPHRAAPAAAPPRITPPVIAAPAAPPPAAPDQDPAWLAAFTSRVQAAVQAAAVYPPAARAQHRQGRVRIRFDYVNGAAAAPAILVSSSQPILDRAALRAVQSAAYPSAPVRARLQLLVWVDFKLEG
jgi:TonB family protein